MDVSSVVNRALGVVWQVVAGALLCVPLAYAANRAPVVSDWLGDVNAFSLLLVLVTLAGLWKGFTVVRGGLPNSGNVDSVVGGAVDALTLWAFAWLLVWLSANPGFVSVLA